MTMACAAVPPEEEPPVEVGNSGYRCGVQGLQDLVGRPATSELGTEALRRSGSRTLRWIRPGDAVTMDYREDRLNVRLDAANRVEGFTCG
jgi:hypothetical protein